MSTYLLTIFLCTVCLYACAQPEDQPVPATQDYADLVIRGGEVITVDAALKVQHAVAVTGAYIVAVGTNAEMQAYVGQNTEVLELNGKTLIPGFIEGHGHFLGYGRAQQILDLSQANSFAGIVAQVAIAVDGAEPGEWIFGQGWHQDKWQQQAAALVDGVPLNRSLNAVSPNNPVYLGHASGHAAFANDLALALAGIDKKSSNPQGGTIVRAEDGRATGLLRENAQSLIRAAIGRDQKHQAPEIAEQNLREQIRLAGQAALSYGITSFHDAGASFAEIDLYKKLEAEGELAVRLYVMVRGESNADMATRLADYYMPAQGDDYLAVRSIKRQIDGALGAHGAWLLEPYEDLPDTAGLVLEPITEIEETARIAIAHGYQVNTHAIGTRANRETLDLYERVWAAQKTNGTSLRWRIEHAQHIHPTDIPRFAQLGVIAAIQGVHCTSDGPWIPSRLGEQRTMLTSYRWRDLIDSGARINNGTDVPVERINPLASYYASVARTMNNGEPFFPEQAMTPMEALHSYTLDNAYSAFEENLKGSITPGKLADLVVLSQNIVTISADKIMDTKVEMTFVGGKLRYTQNTH